MKKVTKKPVKKAKKPLKMGKIVGILVKCPKCKTKFVRSKAGPEKCAICLKDVVFIETK
jgi:endogenous inhibitor of DNA gyrase (YacG/DUF329 family)